MEFCGWKLWSEHVGDDENHDCTENHPGLVATLPYVPVVMMIQ